MDLKIIERINNAALGFQAGRTAIKALAVAASATIIGTLAGPAAQAGTISSADTYAADANGLALPTGTVVVFDYVGYRHDDAIVDPNGTTRKANGNVYTNISRVDWFAGDLFGHPLILHAAIPYARVEGLSAPFPNIDSDKRALPGGSGFFSPVVFATLGLIVDPKNERFLGFTDYYYFNAQKYDASRFNASTPNQSVDVTQLVYAEGLGKFSPALKSFWVDVIPNASFHSDGSDPINYNLDSNFPGSGLNGTGVRYTDVKQDNAYDVKAFLRYNWNPLMWLAVGVEKSWGGRQVATGRVISTGNAPIAAGSGALLGGPAGSSAAQVVGGGIARSFQAERVIGYEDYLKGHVTFQMPLAPDFAIAADLTHDFRREGNLREDFTAEIRFTKLFIGQPPVEPLK